ncbi:MAG TPA: hypothetical protein PKY77_07920 [Phycisphaerae bacterium]|nr:hypothetical protein [Phycisphaerae bacterium]HRY66511.1 hypothetical protein [Phycisphaerae bacterium]HSA28623.1 hypothetical protein [Phycisphaerae bacterium]
MSWRLSDLVIGGEIINTKNYSTHGYIALRGLEQPILLQLTGNCEPDLFGRHIRFEVRPRGGQGKGSTKAAAGEGEASPRDLSGLARRQIGPTGMMTANHRVKDAGCSIHELIMRCKPGEPPPVPWKRCLYLEWFSQNGQVLVEIPDPIIDFVGEDEAEPQEAELPADGHDPEGWEGGADTDDSAGPSITEVWLDADGRADIREVAPDEMQGCDDSRDCRYGCSDPYGLISDDLQRQLDAQSRELDRAIRGDTEDADDADFARDLELMDECIARGEGEPVGGLFDLPIKMPLPDQLADDEIESHLKALLGQMALHGVALDVCEHFTPRDCYRLLIEEICRNQNAYAELRGTRWVQHFMTSEYCEACEEEMRRQSEEDRLKGGQPPEEGGEGG